MMSIGGEYRRTLEELGLWADVFRTYGAWGWRWWSLMVVWRTGERPV